MFVCDLPVSMRLRSRLSTTAALLSMCFCSVSNAASSLSTYWLVSCRHWPQTHTCKHTHTQSPMNIHRTMADSHKERKGRGGKERGSPEKRENKKKRVKRLESGQKNWENQDVNEECSISWKFLQPLVMLMMWLDLTVRAKETEKPLSEEHITDQCFFFLFGRLGISCAQQICTRATKHTRERTESKKQRGEVKLISKKAQTSGSHLCYWRFLRWSQSLHLQPGQDKEKTFIYSKYHKPDTYQHIKNMF